MKQRAAELRAEKRGGAKKADEAEACVEAITALPQPDRGLAEAIHRIVLDVAPGLDPKTWYGFPSYARDGKVVVSSSLRRSSSPATPPSGSRRLPSWTTARCG